jgi:hypothetical protein
MAGPALDFQARLVQLLGTRPPVILRSPADAAGAPMPRTVGIALPGGAVLVRPRRTTPGDDVYADNVYVLIPRPSGPDGQRFRLSFPGPGGNLIDLASNNDRHSWGANYLEFTLSREALAAFRANPPNALFLEPVDRNGRQIGLPRPYPLSRDMLPMLNRLVLSEVDTGGNVQVADTTVPGQLSSGPSASV